MPLPTLVELTFCASGEKEPARIETLDREAAKTHIDIDWWNDLTSTLRDPADEPDRHWKWRVILSAVQNKPFFHAKCVKTINNAIQAAMLFRVDQMSVLSKGMRAVFVDRLATAPRNRENLVETPIFRGGGTGLLVYAIAQSYFLGFEGRVSLFPVANEDFYSKMGFIPTDELVGDDRLFELPAERALDSLRTRGLIDV